MLTPRFLLLLLYTVCVLCGISFIYSYSAWKGDFRQHFDFDEVTAAYVFTYANLGQNFVVHMGYLYDKKGMVVTSVLSGFLKLVGNLGMFCVAGAKGFFPATQFSLFLAQNKSLRATLFGLFFAMDAQATGAAIIMAQMEAQKKTPAQFKGIVGSICAASFGLGATLWVAAYDSFFKPDIEQHFFFSAMVSGLLLLGYAPFTKLLFSTSAGPSTTSSTAGVLAEDHGANEDASSSPEKNKRTAAGTSSSSASTAPAASTNTPKMTQTPVSVLSSRGSGRNRSKTPGTAKQTTRRSSSALRSRSNNKIKKGPKSSGATGGTSSTQAGSSSSMAQIILGRDFIALFSATLVTWSVAMVFIAHLGSMADAAGFTDKESANVRSLYFSSSTVGRLLAGPIVDLTVRQNTMKSLTLEFWVWMTTFVTGCTTTGLIATGLPTFLTPAAVIIGLAFGAISTLVPLMCRQLKQEVAGTLYAVAKVGSLVLSTVWIGHAGNNLEVVKKLGPKNGQNGKTCLGNACYEPTMFFITFVSLPLISYTAVWAMRSLAVKWGFVDGVEDGETGGGGGGGKMKLKKS
ncbi:unnamed protein product [Amoebophrya sp. A120]|nr:unnamed protein product [Amoebophrya sp. A120]|eukprot:GSA120T00007325001.1